MDKLLILGVDTLVGSNLALTLADHCEVTALVGDSCPELSGFRTLACDVQNPDELTYHVLNQSPRAVIHCGSLSASAWDLAGNPEIDPQQEATTACVLAAAAERAGSQLVAIATDALFAGPRMFHTEISPTTAAGAAAEAARALEQALARTSALVLRTHAYGWGTGGLGANFAEYVWRQLSADQGCTVDAQAYATPILASDLAEFVLSAIRAELRGLYHLTGAERTSQYRFAAELAVAFGFTGRQVLLEAPVQVPPPRPFVHETSLNTRAIRRALERPLPMLREGLSRLVEQATSGYRAQLQSPSRPVRVREHAA